MTPPISARIWAVAFLPRLPPRRPRQARAGSSGDGFSSDGGSGDGGGGGGGRIHCRAGLDQVGSDQDRAIEGRLSASEQSLVTGNGNGEKCPLPAGRSAGRVGPVGWTALIQSGKRRLAAKCG